MLLKSRFCGADMMLYLDLPSAVMGTTVANDVWKYISAVSLTVYQELERLERLGLVILSYY